MDAGLQEDHVERKLGKPEIFAGIVIDETGKLVAGAKIAVETIAHSTATDDSIGTTFYAVPREVLGGSTLEGLFETTTGADGSFGFRTFVSGSGLKLAVTTSDGRRALLRPAKPSTEVVRRHLEETGFTTSSPSEKTIFVLVPAARVSGRVVSKVQDVDVAGLEVYYQASRARGPYQPMRNSSGGTRTDTDGRFSLDGLDEGTINIVVHGDGENREWTYRAASDVKLTHGVTSDVVVELIRGVVVEGTVVAKSANVPLPGAQVGVYGPFRPRSGAMTTGATTDIRGRFRYRLPEGETYFYVMGPPNGFTRLSGERSSRTVTIPEGAREFEVPPIELAPAVTMRGHLLDSDGKPIDGAKVVGICENGLCRAFPGRETVTDLHGEFRLPPGMYNTVAIGKSARLLIRLRGGAEYQAATIPAADGAVTIKLEVGGKEIKGAVGPRDVAPDELPGNGDSDRPGR
jgi:hypothetical protein